MFFFWKYKPHIGFEGIDFDSPVALIFEAVLQPANELEAAMKSRKNDWNDAEKLAKVARVDRTMFSRCVCAATATKG